MVRKSEIKFLRLRAEKFLKNAKGLYEEGIYDLAAFNVEQCIQLLLKYKLFLKIGYYPRTHSLKRLLRELSEVNEKLRDKLLTFYERHIETISNIENAHIMARYMPGEYEKSEVEKMLKVAEKLKKLLLSEEQHES